MMAENFKLIPRALPWHQEGEFVVRADGTSVCKVNGMENDARIIVDAVNAYYLPEIKRG